jgi:hypothetical protein
VTATRDRRSDPAEDAAETAWDDRPILGSSRGLPWWAAVLLAFGLAIVGAVVDMVRQDSLGKIYQGAYLVGCVAAICWVRRRSLFGPMVQPPLVFAVTAIGAVIALAPDTGGSGGLRGLVFTVALPLTSNFPTMAITTGVTVAIGLYRLWKERDPNPPVRMNPRPTRDDEPPSRGERSKDRVPPGGRSARGRGGNRQEEAPEARRRGSPTREGREQSPRDRSNRREPPPGRSSRGRARDQDPPPRRRDSTDRPRRDERPGPNRRDQSDRSGRQPRRRPPEQYR